MDGGNDELGVEHFSGIFSGLYSIPQQWFFGGMEIDNRLLKLFPLWEGVSPCLLKLFE